MIRRLVGGLGELLITAGALVLLFVAWQLWWTDVVAERDQERIVQALADDFASGGTGLPPEVADAYPDLDEDAAFAIVRVPRFGEDYARPVIEGTGRPVLELGVGHYDGSADPGEVGNFAIAGHRTTYGRPFHTIDALREGDRVIIETRPEVFVYEIESSEIVRPWETQVIQPVPDDPGAAPEEALITMTSCHPKYSATHRYVTHGRLVETVPREQWRLEDWNDVTGPRVSPEA
ncbi:class E sortase [Phycicoccus sp. BSK3Z-2]|uniref:Class E sortase n=1 Tax=Phycicoccus avicenniae TaxID=2828860 RepID=A0A941D5M1_9MICO|nr:class E sortase [Phycicoccus avicenniae]MBR7742554.1 class E sortase [Phycicoccus avicenniae]